MSWPTMMFNLQRTGAVVDDFAPPLHLSWKVNLGKYVWDHPTIVGNTVFVDSHQGIQALDLASGQLKWSSSTVKSAGRLGITRWMDKLVVCALNGFSLLDMQTGRELWHHPGNGICCLSPCVIGNIAIVVDSVDWRTKHMLAIALPHGEVLWQFAVPHLFRTAPSIYDSVVIFSDGERLQALDYTTGEVRWAQDFQGWRTESRLVHPNNSLYTFPIAADRIVVPIRSGLFAISVQTGEIMWHSAPFRHSPCILDGVIYGGKRGATNDQLCALALETGAELWSSEARFWFDASSPIVVGEHIHVGAAWLHQDNWWVKGVYTFDRHTGQQVGVATMEDHVRSTPAYADGHLIIGCHDHHLYCFKAA